MYKRLALTVLALSTFAAVAHAEEGRFIKGSSAAIYAATRTQKRWIISPMCYVAAGGKANFSDTVVLPDAELAAIPDAAPVLCEKAFVRFADSATVYMVQGGLLRSLSNPPCAFKNGVAQNWSNVITLDARWSQSYGFGASVCPGT